MARRILVSAMWFLSVWGIGGVVHLFIDFPRALALVPAIMAAALWWWLLARQERLAGATPSGELARPAVAAPGHGAHLGTARTLGL